MSSGLRVTMDDVRLLPPRGHGWCTRGAKSWCDEHGYNFRELLQEGWSVEFCESKDDPFLQRLAKSVRDRAAKESRS